MKRILIKLVAFTVAAIIGYLLFGNLHGARAHAQTPGLATAPPAPLTGAWTADPAHTNVTFGIRHMGISEVRGRFDDFTGAIVADVDHPENASVQFTIQSTSIDTNVKMRDDDLRSDHYLDVAKYPQITFQSTAVRKGKHGSYVADGNLTIHGVTKQISLPFQISGPISAFGSSRFGLQTQIHLNRLDYGVGGSDKLPTGELALGSDIDVAISLEATSAKPAGQ